MVQRKGKEEVQKVQDIAQKVATSIGLPRKTQDK
jgi:hypothetical protein